MSSSVYPLDMFSPEHRAHIEELANAPTPPPKYLTIRDEHGLALAQIESRAWYEWHFRRTGRDPRLKREKTPAWMRRAVIDRDGLTCGICNGEVAANDVHIDHIRPIAHGGATTLTNLQVTHSKCNLDKGAYWEGGSDARGR